MYKAHTKMGQTLGDINDFPLPSVALLFYFWFTNRLARIISKKCMQILPCIGKLYQRLKKRSGVGAEAVLPPPTPTPTPGSSPQLRATPTPHPRYRP